MSKEEYIKAAWDELEARASQAAKECLVGERHDEYAAWATVWHTITRLRDEGARSVPRRTRRDRLLDL